MNSFDKALEALYQDVNAVAGREHPAYAFRPSEGNHREPMFSELDVEPEPAPSDRA
jgi:hypothetical protein